MNQPQYNRVAQPVLPAQQAQPARGRYVHARLPPVQPNVPVLEQPQEQAQEQQHHVEPQLEQVGNQFERIAREVGVQIRSDVQETLRAIEKYGLDSHELLHVIERWLRSIIQEFSDRKEFMNGQLREHWERGSLSGDRLDDGGKMRNVLGLIKALQRLNLHHEISELERLFNSPDTDDFEALSRTEIRSFLQTLETINGIGADIVSDTFAQSKSDHNASAIRSDIDKVKGYISNLKKLNEETLYKVCVVGLEKSGKSTFLNHLIGSDILPTDEQRCTQVNTSIRPGRVLKADVRYFDTANNEVIESDNEADVLDSVKRIIADPNSLGVVHSVTIHTPRLLENGNTFRNFELVDVPGFDTPDQAQRDFTTEAMRSCDAFLFVHNGTRPSHTDPEVKFFQEIKSIQNNIMDKGFAIITQMDRANDYSSYQRMHYACMRNNREVGFQEGQIYPVCRECKQSRVNSISGKFQDPSETLCWNSSAKK